MAVNGCQRGSPIFRATPSAQRSACSRTIPWGTFIFQHLCFPAPVFSSNRIFQHQPPWGCVLPRNPGKWPRFPSKLSLHGSRKKRVLTFPEQRTCVCVAQACEAGGQLLPTPNFPYGKDSRSLKGAYRAVVAGCDTSQVKHLMGGVYLYSQEGYPFVGRPWGRAFTSAPCVVLD